MFQLDIIVRSQRDRDRHRQNGVTRLHLLATVLNGTPSSRGFFSLSFRAFLHDIEMLLDRAARRHHKRDAQDGGTGKLVQYTDGVVIDLALCAQHTNFRTVR